MSEKRKRDVDDTSGDHAKGKKRTKRGFVVGPDNLPDGPLRRKNQKIKAGLIQRAQIKKDYEKFKRQGKVPDDAPNPPELASEEPKGDEQEASIAPHPDRQTLIDEGAESPAAEQQQQPVEEWRRRRKPKSAPFKRERDQAERRKSEAEERRKAREEAERQRQRKLEERERFRKTMAKARSGGPNGQRRLGLESKVLLEKVKRMVGEEK